MINRRFKNQTVTAKFLISSVKRLISQAHRRTCHEKY
ncbi:hypothetical protein SS7213T_05941 [Staphylococcus simiae CCM 7213 = CCUG 51256]|uniref:Uncharacterized protein n=1 Tax=Staphylococcus simiae CCM 7213 = CCUG 51256 TaxID=911238 RepID=G5JIA2_9STAP|nr:hypothetical protein SS7213T_05941 [Staphylococcus simiae CCM 7213 = CCUG 51256]